MGPLQTANAIAHQVKSDLSKLVTKDEKIALLNEAEKLIGHNGLGLFIGLFIENIKAEVLAEPDTASA